MKTYQSSVLHAEPEHCSPGFTLVAPMAHEMIELVDLAGNAVHRRRLPGRLGSKACLLENGNLLCSVSTCNGAPLPGAIPNPGALGGWLLELDWDGNVVCEHTDANQHHDLCRLENGNTLICESLNGASSRSPRKAAWCGTTSVRTPGLCRCCRARATRCFVRTGMKPARPRSATGSSSAATGARACVSP